MEKDIETITLEDNLEYGILDKIKDNSRTYIYLFQIENPKIVYIRKTDGELLYGLESEEEYNKALKLFQNKHKDLLKDIKISN